MILFVGDVHGHFTVFDEITRRIFSKLVEQIGEEAAKKEFTVVQVGDFGFYDRTLLFWNETPYKVFAIDGNHEDFRLLKYDSIKEIRDNLFYVPRGSIMNISGYNIGFCGGGFSIDKAYRKEGISWFPEEEVLEKDIAPLIGKDLDIVVTHTPPRFIIDQFFPKLNAENWGLDPNWKDYSAIMIEKLYNNFSMNTQFICGHMHKSLVVNNVRILDINEFYPVANKGEGYESSSS